MHSTETEYDNYMKTEPISSLELDLLRSLDPERFAAEVARMSDRIMACLERMSRLEGWLDDMDDRIKNGAQGAMTDIALAMFVDAVRRAVYSERTGGVSEKPKLHVL